MKIQRKVVEELADSLEESYLLVAQELNNDRDVISEFSTAGLMEIDKLYLEKQIEGLILVLKKLKAIKAFNYKKPM
ncbi:MAG TPA: hypothetical protein VFG54_12385 [Prolixibacteraceae bacterium]|nr:hypothetical protein [Prolixibacteraceae bacterium]